MMQDNGTLVGWLLKEIANRHGLLTPLLVVMLAVDLAVLAVLLGPLGALSQDGAAASPLAGTEPQRAAAASFGERDGDSESLPAEREGAEGRPPPRPAAVPVTPPPGSALLCVPQDTLLYEHDERAAVAVDRAGHLTFYGAPDATTGRPTKDSYEILRDCSPELSHANSLAVRVDGGEPEAAGAETNLARTRKGRSGDLVTVHRFSGGVELTQRVRLVAGEDGTEALEISYRLDNRSGAEKRVDLKSLLNPPLWNVHAGKPAYRVPAIADRPIPEGGRKNGRVVTERTLAAGDVSPFFVPRAGAASIASARWEPGPVGPKPNAVTFASALRLGGPSPFEYDAELGKMLPPNSAFAAYWTGLDLAPGEGETLSHRYVTGPDALPKDAPGQQGDRSR